jgi:hypothetical protein
MAGAAGSCLRRLRQAVAGVSAIPEMITTTIDRAMPLPSISELKLAYTERSKRFG